MWTTIRNKFSQWLRPQPKGPEIPRVDPVAIPIGLYYESPRGKIQNTPKEPFVFYGHASDSCASFIAALSTMNTLAVTDLNLLETCLKERMVVGLAAMSRTEFIGEAGTAITLARTIYGDSLPTFYCAWDYNTERAALRAMEYKAHGILMPGIDLNEFTNYLFNMLALIHQGYEIPTTVEQHQVALKRLAPQSAFWEMQDLIKSQYH